MLNAIMEAHSRELIAYNSARGGEPEAFYVTADSWWGVQGTCMWGALLGITAACKAAMQALGAGSVPLMLGCRFVMFWEMLLKYLEMTEVKL